ncbi:MAG: hypothetical protein AB1611_18980 [bacterium]
MKQEYSCRRQVNLACQGLITRNSIAYELACHFIPQGNVLFSRLQRYDSFLSEAKLSGAKLTSPYQPGKFLCYLLPFLKAFGATDRRIAEYSTVSISLVPGAGKFLDMIRACGIPCFFVSSAYRPFIESLGHLLGFRDEEAYYTPMDLDSTAITISELETLKDLADEIINMPPLSWTQRSAVSSTALVPEHLPYCRRLEIILTEEISGMEIGKILTQGAALTGIEKVTAVKDSLEKTGNPAEGILYFGGSILDADALSWVRKSGGLAVSFNGDKAALQAAEVAVMSGNSAILAIISDVFYNQGKEGVLELIGNWDLHTIQTDKLKVHPSLVNELFSHEPDLFPLLELVTRENLERLAGASESCRRMILGGVM